MNKQLAFLKEGLGRLSLLADSRQKNFKVYQFTSAGYFKELI